MGRSWGSRQPSQDIQQQQRVLHLRSARRFQHRWGNEDRASLNYSLHAVYTFSGRRDRCPSLLSGDKACPLWSLLRRYHLSDSFGAFGFDLDRFASDPSYAGHWANTNLFTHFIFQSDSNTGNLLISVMASNPRIFSVDNGVAFQSEESNRGTRWRRLQVDRFPASTVERLRSITEQQLHDLLGVLAQWEVVEGELARVEPTENLRRQRGVREEDGVIQIGLTDEEIDDVWTGLNSSSSAWIGAPSARFEGVEPPHQ